MNTTVFEKEYLEKHNGGRCEHCEYIHPVSANGGFTFLGCYCEPYHGKWVAEIEDCPKEKGEEDECTN